MIQATPTSRRSSATSAPSFLLSWLKVQGIDDALIQPYSGHEPPAVPGGLLPAPWPTRSTATTRVIDRHPA
jgi:hypothetical protein